MIYVIYSILYDCFRNLEPWEALRVVNKIASATLHPLALVIQDPVRYPYCRSPAATHRVGNRSNHVDMGASDPAPWPDLDAIITGKRLHVSNEY